MIQAFIDNPLLLLFFTMAIGYGVGLVSIRGFKLSVAAVLFVGLFLGALNQEMHIPEFIIYFGLAIYIYAIGLSSAPTFFNNVRQNGVRDIGLIIFMLTITVSIAVGIHFLFHFNPQTTSGIYAGATTNTAALAGLIDLINSSTRALKSASIQSDDVVAAYSIAYPVGVAGTLLSMMVMKRLLRINFKTEEESLIGTYPIKREIVYHTILITQENIAGKTIRDIKKSLNSHIIFGRIVRQGETILSSWDTVLEMDDKVILTGVRRDVDQAAHVMGQVLDEDISDDRSEYTSKRFFVTNPAVAGQPISNLNIDEHFSAVITRIQRGDLVLLPSSKTILELGDMVRFVAKKENMPKLAKILGDSYEALGKVNLLTFGLGLAMGLFVGMINFQLPGGINFRLGYAGGPILVALILGSLRRTGKLVWTMPYGANETFKQFGLALLLAGIGVNAGHTFLKTLGHSSSIWIVLSGLAISFISAAISLVVGYKLLKIPFSILMGMVSHQPALLDYSMSQTNNKLPVVGFTLMLPIALIVKIIYVQILYLFLS
jgi:putative transport protein